MKPVTVVFQTTGVPVGNNVKLTVTPAYGATVTAVSPAITGTTTLLAQTTYTITVAMGQALSMFAQNEQVERIAINALPGKANQYFLVTAQALARLTSNKCPDNRTGAMVKANYAGRKAARIGQSVATLRWIHPPNNANDVDPYKLLRS